MVDAVLSERWTDATTPRPKVVYWNNIPSPYMVERLNAVADRNNIDLEAWFSARTEFDRSWAVEEKSWRFRYRYLPAISIAGRRLVLPTPILRGPIPDVMFSLYAELPFLIGWLIARRRGVRTAFWTEVTFDSWVRRRPWKEALKRWIFPRVTGVLTVGQDGRDFAMKYGAPLERIHYAPHTIDVEHYSTGWKAALPERDQIRSELGLKGTTFIYVGRMFDGKGLDHFFDAYAELQRRLDQPISLLMVGDGPDEQHLRERCAREGLQNVVFAGFQQKPVVPRFYAAADVFVFPTLGDPYGLVVDEAMACSMPVISTSSAGEIRDRIEDGVNGFIVPPANSAALLDRMEVLARDSELRSRMGETSSVRIAGHTPERWAMDLEHAVDAIIASNQT
jgi:glycosyltransferase involved in cell wall biosynthesis